jgi:dolichyl-phosphate-mannose-protein mannosyltransferase
MTDRAPWRVTDWTALAAVTAVAALLRLWHLGQPEGLVFDEGYYVPDACSLSLGEEACGTSGLHSRVHPFLARWVIGAGIKLFGYEAFGWRIAAVAFGVISVALLYVLAHRLFASTVAASGASAFLALDGLHFVQSRLGVLDIFVATFALAAVLFVVIDRDRRRRPDERLRDRPWLLAAGLAAGAATASKWSGLPFLLVVAGLAVVWDTRADHGTVTVRTLWRTVAHRSVLLVGALAVLPLVVYTVSFVGVFDARLQALPWERGSWLRSFLGWQKHILTFGVDLGGNYPYTSGAWSWPLLKRPVVHAFNEEASGAVIRHILALGNPALWWGSIVAVVVCLVRWLRGRGGPEGVILAGIVAGYLWWLPVTASRTFSFSFYMTPALPFMCLALVRVGQLIWDRFAGKVAVVAMTSAVVGAFVFFYPILAWQPLGEDTWSARMWFTDCRPESVTGDPPRPNIVPSPPPDGWCWI